MEKYQKLLSVYTLEEILDNLDLEPEDVLAILDDQGYMDTLTLPEPL